MESNSDMLRGRALVGSTALHGIAIFLMHRELQPVVVWREREVEVELRRKEPRVIDVEQPTRRRSTKRRASPSSSPSLSPSPSLSLSPSPSLSLSPSPSPSPSSVDLFDRGVLSAIASAGASPAGNGVDHSPAADAQARVDDWLREGAAERLAESGAIDPSYRVIERRLREEFRPPREVVKHSSWGGHLRDQLRAFFGDPSRVREGPMERYSRRMEGRDDNPGDPPGLNFRSLPFEQQLACQRAIEEPVWIETDVEIVLEADGSLREARIVGVSGRRRFDRYALEEVKRVASLQVATLPRAARLVFRMRGSYVAKIPRSGLSFRFDETGQLDRKARGIRRFIALDHPTEEIRSEVLLRAFEPL